MGVDDPNHCIDDALKQVKHLSVKWLKKYPPLGKYIVKMEWEPHLICLNHHINLRRMMYTTNLIERFNKSTWKTLKIRGAFTDGELVIAWITGTAIDKGETAYKYPIHNFSFRPSFEQTRI